PISTGEYQSISPFQYSLLLVLGVPPPIISATSPSLRCSQSSLNPGNRISGTDSPFLGNIFCKNPCFVCFRFSNSCLLLVIMSSNSSQRFPISICSFVECGNTTFTDKRFSGLTDWRFVTVPSSYRRARCLNALLLTINSINDGISFVSNV